MKKYTYMKLLFCDAHKLASKMIICKKNLSCFSNSLTMYFPLETFMIIKGLKNVFFTLIDSRMDGNRIFSNSACSNSFPVSCIPRMRLQYTKK